VLANGGRVLNVTALGGTVAEAQRQAYAGIGAIDWPGGFCRRDIGWRAIAREHLSGNASMLPDLYPGFETRRFKTDGAEIHARIGGKGPPLVLLHGYPQTHVIWHRVAPDLAKHCTLIIPDLRGYGQSSIPADATDHATFSKRAMAADIVSIMKELGHTRFMVAGHDRGARVAYRLALDHPQAVSRLIPIDILPTVDVWDNLRWGSAIKSYHWQFLAQPSPLPETLIGGNPAFYVDKTLASWTMSKTLAELAPDALAHYRAALQGLGRVHAVCEDYRAGATFDRLADEKDRAAGTKIACPTLVLWGSDYVGKGSVNPLDIWRKWCTDVTGVEITSGHFLVEENPADTLKALVPFIKAASGA
jgi:haloacetate dehalogenase